MICNKIIELDKEYDKLDKEGGEVQEYLKVVSNLKSN